MHHSTKTGSLINEYRRRKHQTKTTAMKIMAVVGKNKLKQADRPDFVTASGIATLCYDNHSSRRRITPPLKLSTRTLREPPQRVPI